MARHKASRISHESGTPEYEDPREEYVFGPRKVGLRTLRRSKAGDRINGMENGRDQAGRFAPGNPGGPGRPKRAVEKGYLRVLCDACPPDVWKEITKKAVEQATQGDAKARAWLAMYLLPAGNGEKIWDTLTDAEKNEIDPEEAAADRRHELLYRGISVIPELPVFDADATKDAFKGALMRLREEKAAEGR